MSSPVPSDADLRAFLLGTLPADGVESVTSWLAADPAHVASVERFAVHDSLTDALSNRGDPESVSDDVVDRLARSVTDALHDTSDSTSETGVIDDGGTMPQLQPPSLTPPPVWPPVRLGQFRVVRELGHGGMGYVFEAEDEKLGRRVAVKVLAPEVASRPDAAARFLREARAAAAVEHENVVPVLHVGEEGATPYIVMPLLKGESLESRLKREGALPTEDMIRVGREVATGLGAAHARGLVHRDMKPANVWLDPDGRTRVLDFGLARLSDGADAMTHSGVLSGTPAYMAPELLDGKPATPLSDLFGLGATLYECATGRRAFGGPTVSAVLAAVATRNPQPPHEVNPAVPPALSAVIMHLLAKNPLERPATADEVVAAMAGTSAGPASTITRVDTALESPAARPTRIPRQLRIGCTITISLCLILAIIGVQRTQLPAGHHSDNEELPWLSNLLDELGRPDPPKPPPPAPYRGRVDVKVARTIDGRERLLRLNEFGALPLRQNDPFVIEVEIDPPAYIYVVWVDPDRDITPVYPWNAKQGWNTRPAKEEPVGKVTLPPDVKNRYRAPAAKPGVATMVMFARSTPLDVPDAEVEKWFKELPEIELPKGGDAGAVWFENFVEVKEPNWLRTFGVLESGDPFIRWQGQLQMSLGGKVKFQAAVSFARTGRK